ncbi:MAG: hypothetical protein IJZ88_04840 [Clostridia bacterium]|nr:hypothetical protein [Clostridia bacterium]
MDGFYEYNGKVTEGYLGKPEDFNGVIFLLKEPNNKTQAEEFWFKKMLKMPEEYEKETKISKSIFTRFKNRFNEMLDFIGKGESLEDAVFCNVNPVKGDAKETDKVEEALKQNKPEEMLDFFCTLKDGITIFTCKNIYHHLLESDKIQIKTKKSGSGLRYKNKTLGCFEGEVNNTKVTVYEIFHPSRSSKIEL